MKKYTLIKHIPAGPSDHFQYPKHLEYGNPCRIKREITRFFALLHVENIHVITCINAL